ncbi:MAG: GTP cyclohydrolase II [Paracoccaceae bacterium]
MTLAPTPLELRARARADLRAGGAVVLSLADTSVLVAAAEIISDEKLSDFQQLGIPVLTITRQRAETLKVRCYDGDVARVPLPADADRLWVASIADPADDLRAPMKGPLMATRGGDAAVHRRAIALIKDARLLPAALVVDIATGPEFAVANSLTHIELAAPSLEAPELIAFNQVVSARIPLEVSKSGRLYVFRPEDGGEEHYAVEIGRPDRAKPVLTRLHSACFTGDLLGSLKCDCGPQLRTALKLMGEEGSGVLLYLNQEGRGIGLANKMRAYSLQDQGFDTVEANHRLGFEDDERDFRIGASILKKLGFSAVRLLTNNPAKVVLMQENGVEVVERLALKVGQNPLNIDYLKTKASKSGHLL